jgi:hypothetical protein
MGRACSRAAHSSRRVSSIHRLQKMRTERTDVCPSELRAFRNAFLANGMIYARTPASLLAQTWDTQASNRREMTASVFPRWRSLVVVVIAALTVASVVATGRINRE